MGNKSNKNLPKSTACGCPPSHKKAKVFTPVVESEKSCPKARQRPPKKLFEDEADLAGNNNDGQGDFSHDDDMYAASIALLSLAQGDETKSSRAGSIIAKNGDEKDEMEIVVDNVDGGAAQEDGEDEDTEPSLNEDKDHKGLLSLCLEVLHSIDSCWWILHLKLNSWYPCWELLTATSSHQIQTGQHLCHE